jgi:hypothetical protein
MAETKDGEGTTQTWESILGGMDIAEVNPKRAMTTVYLATAVTALGAFAVGTLGGRVVGKALRGSR